VAPDVGQRFLRGPVHGQPCLGGELARLPVNLEGDRRAALLGERVSERADPLRSRKLVAALGIVIAYALRNNGVTTIAVPVECLIGFVILSAVLGLIAATWPARRAANLDVLARSTPSEVE